jgi:DNA-binding transcriptional MerR regulator
MTATAPRTGLADRQPDGDRFTIEELARRVGMSPRNIRAHQARRLLAPPVRIGRTAYYDISHVRRMEAITALQRQGFNLVAIDAILGAQGADPDSDKLAAMLQRLGAEHPSLVYALSRHGVIGRTEDGTVRTVRLRALRSALDLNRAGVQTVPSLQVLAEVLDSLRYVADDLVRSTGARLLSLRHRQAGADVNSWEQLDQDTVVFAQSLVGLLTEAFRMTVENYGRNAVADLMAAARLDLDLSLDEAGPVDNG